MTQVINILALILLALILPALGYYFTNSINMRICMAVLITIIIGFISVPISVAAMGAFILLEIKKLNINNDKDNINDDKDSYNDNINNNIDDMEYIGDIDDIENMENIDIIDEINK